MTDKTSIPADMDLGDDAEQDMAAIEAAALLNQIKAQADLLGVAYAPNIGVETLSERVRAHKEKEGLIPEEDLTTKEAKPEVTETGLVVPDDIEQQYAIYHAKQLVRVAVTCVNPAKADIDSDLYTVFSSSLGRVSQVIPHQAPKGHHMPRCLADLLRSKTYTAFRESSVQAGEEGCNREHYDVPEFIITELPPLEADELNRIIQRQDRTLAARDLEDN